MPGSEDAPLVATLESTPSYGGLNEEPMADPMTPGKVGNREVIDNISMPSTPNNATTHNDPSLRDLLQSEHLRGSTRMLRQYYQSAPQQNLHRRRWSSGDVMPLMEDHELSLEPNTDEGATGLGLPDLGKQKSLVDSDSPAIGVRASFRGFVSHVHKGFLQDARSLAEGTIPQSVVLSFVIGIVCGVAAYLYYSCLFFLLEFCWHTVPETYIVNYWPKEYHWIYAPLLSFSFAILVGLSVVVLGEPGDLPFTISCIHRQAYIPMNHVIPMFFASLFSILAGGSLGPEAPLVAMCGALGGFVSRQVFGQTNIHVIRKHSLMGMAGALAAFFGCPLGGSLFALEVNSRFGIEYFEHMVEAIFAGEITLVVFRSLSGLPISSIYDLTAENGGQHMTECEPWMVVAGGGIGLLGAFAAYMFAVFHWAQMGLLERFGLLDNSRAVHRALFGCCVISGIGVLIPQTYMWGEEEFQVIATMAPSSELPFVWPTTGLIGFENDSPYKALIIGLAKIVTISYTVAGGFRGGYIFPFFMTGAAFGRVLYAVCPHIPLPVAILSFSAGINVAITRTGLASTIILGFLSGEPFAVPSILAASLCSLFATAYVPFIKTQITRSDIDHSMYHQKKILTKVIHTHNE